MGLTVIEQAVGAAVPALPLSRATAQDAGLGEEIYMQRCAVCHGDSGAGDGMVAQLFETQPADLKHLARENGGQFPFLQAYMAIDGRSEIAGHGRTEMPLWGTFFMDDAIDNPAINEKDARYITEGRLLSVVYYLQSIQQP
jgi:mono/diheme cytochrome c family protein